MRPCRIVQLGPRSNDKCPSGSEEETQGREDGGEVGEPRTQAWGPWSHQKLEETRERPPRGLWSERSSAYTSVLDFRPPDWEKRFPAGPPVCGALLPQPRE